MAARKAAYSLSSPEGGGLDNPAFTQSIEMAPRTQSVPAKVEEAQSQTLTTSSSSSGSSKEEILAYEVDGLQQKLGGYGRYQIFTYCLLGLLYMRGSWHALVPIFQGTEPTYHCNAYPGLPLNESVPPDDDGQCHQYVNYSVSKKTEDCKNGWNFTWDIEGFTSIVTEYDLFCDRKYLIELSTTLYMVGTTCGVLFLAPLSQWVGAKTVMLACCWLQIIVGVALPWSGSIPVLFMLKFFIGLFNMTIAISVAVLMSETFDASHRELPALGLQFFWASGILSLSLLAYLLPDWKDLQVVISIPINVLSILYIWLIPQSLPWLLSKGKFDKAERVVNRFIRVNKLPSIPNLRDILAKFDLKGKNTHKSDRSSTQPDQDDPHLHSSNILVHGDSDDALSGGKATYFYIVKVLVKQRKLRLYTCILCYLFLVNALSYFGIIYNTPYLDGNPFLNLFFLGLVEIPAYLICIAANRYIGRRLSIFIFLLICSIANIPIPFIPDQSGSSADLTDLKTVLVMIGKFGITGSYSAIYLYAAEVFPTVIRNQAVGFCSFFENIGSIIAPNMVTVNQQMTNLPLTVFGVMTIVGAVMILFLPETHNQPLPQTIADAESRGRNKHNA